MDMSEGIVILTMLHGCKAWSSGKDVWRRDGCDGNDAFGEV